MKDEKEVLTKEELKNKRKKEGKILDLFAWIDFGFVSISYLFPYTTTAENLGIQFRPYMKVAFAITIPLTVLNFIFVIKYQIDLLRDEFPEKFK